MTKQTAPPARNFPSSNDVKRDLSCRAVSPISCKGPSEGLTASHDKKSRDSSHSSRENFLAGAAAKQTIILGVDPGTQVTGYGLIRSIEEGWEPVDFGAIRPPRTATKHSRYLVIFEAIEHLIDIFKPDAVAVETQFVYKNVQSALKLGMARASVIVAAAKKGVEVFEYAPKEAKIAVVGHGSASKEQVQKMVQMQLNLAQPPEPNDAADALALAICHAYYKDLKCLSILRGN